VQCIKVSPEFECQCQGQRSKVKVTRDRNALSAVDIPQVRTNGMRSLQTTCSSSGRAHFVAARGYFRGRACVRCMFGESSLALVSK